MPILLKLFLTFGVLASITCLAGMMTVSDERWQSVLNKLMCVIAIGMACTGIAAIWRM